MANSAPAAPAPATQADPKSTANNIANAIQNKANGKAPATPPQADAKTPPADPNAGKEKYVVEGKEVWLTPEQARAYVQKGLAFEPKVTQLGHLQHEVGAFLEKLKTDPLSVLTDKRIGLTPEIVLQKVLQSNRISDELKEMTGKWYWENVVEPTKLTPEQKKAREDAKWREEREKQDLTAKEEAVRRENQLRVQQAMNTIKANIAEAMKESGLPNNDTPLGVMMARRVADKMRLAYLQRQAITPKQAIEHVKLELKQLQSAWYDHLDEENLVKELGEKNAEKVKKYFLKLVKESEKQATVTKAPSTRNGERKVMSPDEFHDYLDGLKKGAKA